MSDMALRMTMSLVDEASPRLTAFVTLVESLGPKVTGLANRFSTLERNISKVGSTADANVGKIDKMGASLQKLEANSTALETALGALPAIAVALTNSLQIAATAITATAGTLNTLSSASKTASGNVQGATSSLNQMGNVVNGVTKQVVTLHSVMEGLAARWASMKIFQGGSAIVDESAQMEQVRTKIEALNLPGSQAKAIQNDANDLAKRLGVSVREGLEAYMSAISGLAVTDYGESRKIIQDTLDDAVKTAILLRLRGDTSSVKDITRNLYGLIEARGQTNDSEAARRTLELIQKNNTATGGKLSTKDLETISRQMKSGLGVEVDDEGFLKILAFANQLKASGHGGGGGGMGVSQAGTAATQVYKWGAAGVQNKEAIRVLEAMGLVERGAAKGDSSTTSDNIPPGAIKGSQKAVTDPIGFMMDMAPYALALAMKNKDVFAKGLDLNTDEGLKQALANVALSLFKNVNVANLAVQSWVPGSATRISSEVEQTKQAKGTQEAMEDVNKTYLRNVEKFDAAVKSLEVAIGNNLLPILTPIVESMTQFIDFLGSIANANPAATTLTSIALAVGAVGAALFALQKMFGIFTLLSTFLTGLAGGATAAGGAAAGASGGFAGLGASIAGLVTAIGVAMKWLARAGGLVGMLILLYDALILVFDIKIWGASIGTWVSSFVDGVITKLSNLKVSVMELLGLMSKAEAEKEKQKNNTAQRQNAENAGLLKGRDAWRYEQDHAYDGIPDVPPKPSTNREDKAKQKLIEAAKGLKVGTYNPNAKKGYNAAAGEEQQQFRVDEAEFRSELKSLDALRKQELLDDFEYYQRKEAIVNDYYDKLVGDLEAKKAKLRPDEVAARQRADADILIKETERQAALDKIVGDADHAVREYDAAMSKVQGILDEAQGKKHESRLEKLRQEIVLLQRKARAQNDAEGIQKTDEALRVTDTAIAYEKTFRKYTEINDRVIQQIDIIDAKVKAGLMTEADAAAQKWELRRQESAQLQEILKQLEDLANSVGDPALVQKIALLKIQMQGFATALSPDALKLKNVLEGSFGNFLKDITSRNKTLKASFADLFKSIEQGVMDLIIKNLSQRLFNSLFGSEGGAGVLNGAASVLFGGGAGSSGLGGFLGGIFNMSGSGVEAAAAIPEAGSVFEGIGGAALMSLDVGTNAVPFDMLANIHKDEIVVPAADRDKAIALWQAGSTRTSGLSVQNYFTVPAPTDTRTQAQIAASAANSLKMAHRNL